MPQVYLILGVCGSGRRAIVSDLVSNLDDIEKENFFILYSSEELDNDFYKPIKDSSNTKIIKMKQGSVGIDSPLEFLEDESIIFVIGSGYLNPVNQIEKFKFWVIENNFSLARIITIVNCERVSSHNDICKWYDACIYFSDVVLLNYYKNISNKWFNNYQKKFKKEFYPCLFEFASKGKLSNPAKILYPEVRRLSHYFDVDYDQLVDEGSSTVGTQLVYEIDSCENENILESNKFGDIDPYFEEKPNGSKVISIPDIKSLLE